MSARWFSPQHRDSDLAQHAHRLELRGSLKGLDWPDLCPACGAPARERLTVRKVFVRRSGRRARTRYVITEARVPYCEACVAKHRAAESSVPPPGGALTYLRSFLIIPAIGAGYMAYLTLPAAQRAPVTEPGGWVGWAIVGFFLVLFLASVAAMIWETRRFRVPPQTAVTRAFDYSDELGNLVEGRRRIYTIQNGAFAERFMTANRTRGRP